MAPLLMSTLRRYPPQSTQGHIYRWHAVAAVLRSAGTSSPCTQGTPLRYTQGTSLHHAQKTSLPHTQGISLRDTQGSSLPDTQRPPLPHTQGTSLPHTRGTPLRDTLGTPLPHIQGTPLRDTQGTSLPHPQGNSLHDTQASPPSECSTVDNCTPGGTFHSSSAREIDGSDRSTQQQWAAPPPPNELRYRSLLTPLYSTHHFHHLLHSSLSSHSSHPSPSFPQDASLSRISLPWAASSSNSTQPRSLLAVIQPRPASCSYSTAVTPPLEASQASQDGLELTDSCVARLKQLQEEEGKPVLLRLSVEGGGCSGFQYVFTLEDAPREDDKVFRRGDAVLLVDDVTLSFVKGSKVNFAEELIRSSFEVIENPNSSSSCGCGASFVAK